MDMSDFFFDRFGAPEEAGPFELKPKTVIRDENLLMREPIDLVSALLQSNVGVMVGGLENGMAPARFVTDNMMTLAALGVQRLYVFMIPLDKQDAIDRYIEEQDDIRLRMQLDKFYPQSVNLPKQYMELIKKAAEQRVKVIGIGSTYAQDRAEDGTPAWAPFVAEDVQDLRSFDRFFVLGDMSMVNDCYKAPQKDCRFCLPTLGMRSGASQIELNTDENGDYIVTLGAVGYGDGGGRSFKQTKSQRLGPSKGSGR